MHPFNSCDRAPPVFSSARTPDSALARASAPLQDAAWITRIYARLVPDKLANGKEPKEARRGCAIAIAIMGRRPPGLEEHACGEVVAYGVKVNILAVEGGYLEGPRLAEVHSPVIQAT